ncbi:MAG: ABC transporter substrate-binding protein [Verrucomicrobiales bacterium]|jgi:NitT/TauT family transport system substrate-binding protein|nr:ABC transporter substrate-binding protein [Verrucomicrobiales bacterium]
MKTSWIKFARLALAGLMVSAASSGFAADGKTKELKKVTIAYVATTCDSTVYIAKTKGFFADEGLDANLVLGDWAFIKEGLALGRIDATQGLVMNYLKPIAEGLDAKFTAGVHRGCLHILAPKDSPVKTAADLKGKRIGVPAIGSSPWVFAVRVVGDQGYDYQKDVEWKPYPAAELKLALEKKQVDAIALADPIAEILLAEGNVRNVVDQATDAPYKDEYCCVIVTSGKLVKRDPQTAAGITRAVLRAAKWIAANPQAAAELAVNGKHISGSVEVNARVLAKLNYVPSVAGGRNAAATAASALKKVGILDKGVEVSQLVKQAFQPLDNVSDAWLDQLPAEKTSQAAPQGINPLPVAGQPAPAHDDCCAAPLTLK